MSVINMNAPFTRDKIKKLKVGDIVLISGKIFTGRDGVHKYLHDGNQAPVNLEDQIIYHCGPVVVKNEGTGEYTVTAAGPTTSIREEPYEWELMRDHNIAAVIGKGGMGETTLDACRKYGCVYFHATGGAAQVLSDRIKKVEGVYLMELGSPEAMWVLQVSRFPVVVTMDSHGNSLHVDIRSESEKKLKELLQKQERS